MDHDARVLVRIGLALCSDRVLLARHEEPREDVAALEDDGRIAGDEVDGAVDVAVAVELQEC